MAGNNTIEFTPETFAKALAADRPVLVDFWAPWCPPCRAIAPTIDQVADETAGRATVGKVNVDEQPDLARRYGVSSIPTLIVLSGGKVVEKFVGVVGKQTLVDALGAHPGRHAPKSMHDGTETRNDTCICEPEPRWAAVEEELG